MHKQTFLVLTLILFGAGCSKSSTPEPTDAGANRDSPKASQAEGHTRAQLPARTVFDAEAYADALTVTQRAAQKASALNYQWVGAQDLESQATEFAAAGNYKDAILALDEALIQNELAIVQAAREAKDWRERIIK